MLNIIGHFWEDDDFIILTSQKIAKSLAQQMNEKLFLYHLDVRTKYL